MQNTTTWLVGLLVGCLPWLAIPELTRGQQPEPTYEHPASRLDVDFSGGTLDKYVETLRKARPKGAANIVITPEAKNLQIPPISLVAVTVDAAVHVLEGPYTLPDGRHAHIGVSSYTIGDSADLVLKVTADIEPLSVRSSVWNVEAALAAGQSAEELLGAVEAVLSLYSQKAEISFHPPTQLLIARGADEQLDLMSETIEQLIRGAERRSEEIARIRDQMEAYEQELSRLKGEIRVAQQTLELANARLEHASSARDRGELRGEVVAEAQLEVAQAETNLDIMANRHKRVTSRLDSLHTALKKWERPKE